MNVKYFKTVCTIMIIFGIIGIAGAIGMLGSNSGSNLVSVILSGIANLLQLVAGVIGRKAAKDGDADKAPLCRKLSYALLVLAVISLVIGFILSKGSAIPGVSENLVATISIIGGIVSLILPVLYFLGARKLDQ